jgi:hypothetical protein
VSTGLHTVHVRVNDAATGRPTPVRIRFSDRSGQYFTPFGRLTEFPIGRNEDVGGNLQIDGKSFAYIDGTCEIALPPGPVLVELSKGPEYRPLETEVVLGAAKLALRLTVERWTDLRADGWYSGDTRAHFLSPHAALLEAAGEDLAVANLLIAECRVPGDDGREYAALPNVLAFSGQRPALESPGHLVVVNSWNTHPVLGGLGLLNCHRLVYPLTFGGPGGFENWSLAAWCDQCHRKGGLVVWTPRPPDHLGGEALADLELGKVDAFETDASFAVLPDWYTLLECGFAVPLVGGSGKDSNAVALGAVRTYGQLGPGEALTYRSWIEAVRAARTFVTAGPLVSFRVADQGPGGCLKLPAGATAVRVQAEARSILPFEALEVVADGTVSASATASGDPATARIETDVPIPSRGWLAARCRASHAGVVAHTSAVRVQVEGQTSPVDAASRERLLDALERTRQWTEREGRFENEKQRQQLAAIFREAAAALSERGTV